MSETPNDAKVEPDNIDPTPQARGLHPHGSSLVCYQDSPHESVRDQRSPERQADTHVRTSSTSQIREDHVAAQPGDPEVQLQQWFLRTGKMPGEHFSSADKTPSLGVLWQEKFCTPEANRQTAPADSSVFLQSRSASQRDLVFFLS